MKMKLAFPAWSLVCALGALAATTSLSAPSLERGFQNPPPAARPWVYWYFMDGNLTREGLTADLEAMRAAGIGGAIFLEVDLGLPRGPVKFMDPEWRKLFAHAAHEAERLGIEIALGSGPGWCGAGGPWVKPEQTMQHLVASETNVTGPLKFEAVLPRPQPRAPFFGMGTLTPETKKQWSEFYQDEFVLAFPKPKGDRRLPGADEKAIYQRAPFSSSPGVKSALPAPAEHPAAPAEECVPLDGVVDLTGRLGPDGRLAWDVPAGEWTIQRFGRTVTGQLTRPAPAPGLGFETGKFEPEPLDAHLDFYLESLIREIGPRKKGPGGGLSILHFDSWEMSAQNWSERFRAEFVQRRGYDPLPYLPAYTGRIVRDVATTERFLWDIRQTAQELVIANHAGRLKARAHRHGLLYSNEPYDMNPCADLSLGSIADLPMGEFWWYGFDTTYSVIEAASIAHTCGPQIVGAEAFTSAPGEDWRGYPGNIKTLGDWAFAAGINRLAFHRYQHQPWLDRWPGMRMGPYGVHWERTQTWWPMASAFHEYLARCQFLLRQGEAVADILFLAGEGAPHVFRPPASATTSSPPDRRGYNFDGCAPETLLERAKVSDGQIVFPEGTSYRLLVLPQTGTMTPGLLRKVRDLVRAGAVVVGPPPQSSPSLSGFPQCDQEVRQLAAELWDQKRTGKGQVIWGPDFAKAQPTDAPERNPLDGARWIWLAQDGVTGLDYPAGQAAFRREFVLPVLPALESARVWITADNGYSLTVNGRSISKGDNFTRVQESDLKRAVRPGTNVFEVIATNGGDKPNPAGLVASVEVRLQGGQTLRWQTDSTWLAGTTPGPGMRPARDLGEFGMAPWNKPRPADAGQHREPLYPEYEPLAWLLRRLGSPPDFEAHEAIRHTHRTLRGTHIYFVANRSANVVETSAVFRVDGMQPELWHPVTGERRALPSFQDYPDRTAVPLRFEPEEAYFIVFQKRARPAKGAPGNFPPVTEVQTIAGSWNVSFGNEWTAPQEATFASLEDWSKRSEPGIKFYSGIATYKKTFEFAPGSSPRQARLFLDLGQVNHLARVRLNGRDLGVVWCAPWRVDATRALKPGTNELEIEVANLWINRLIGDAGLPENERRTWASSNPYKKDSPLVPSGLLGPVFIRHMVPQEN